nr:putative replication associated protein [Crucivirus sp.]
MVLCPVCADPFEILLVCPEPGTASSDVTAVGGAPTAFPKVDFWCGQLETGENGTPHLQMHVKFADRHTWNQAKGWLDSSNWAGAHFEKARVPDKSITYCTKEDTRVLGPFFSPNFKASLGRGKRSDLEGIQDDVDTLPLDVVAKNHFGAFVKYHRGIVAYKALHDKAVARPDHVVMCLMGPPGTGKSLLAANIASLLYPDFTPFYKGIGKWHDGYMGEPVMILDDFDGLGQSVREVKNIFDKTPCIIEVKGATVALRTRLTIITTNDLPRNWKFSDRTTEADIAAILRRMSFFHVKENMWCLEGPDDGGDHVFPGTVPALHVSSAGRTMRADIMREVSIRRLGGHTEFTGVEGERLLHTSYDHRPDARGAPTIFAQMRDAMNSLGGVVLPARGSPRVVQVRTPDRGRSRERVAPGAPERRRPEWADLPIPRGNSPVPVEGSVDNPILLL